MIRVRDLLLDGELAPGGPRSTPPLVSVVMPTCARCASGALARAVASVLGQSFGDFEFIVVDDGSVDGTRDFLMAQQAQDPRLVYLRHARNCGLPALRVNEGIELARGRYLAFQFDDDEWLPGALATLVEAAEAESGRAAIFGGAESLGDELSGPRWSLPPEPVDEVLLSFRNRIANNAVLVPRWAFDRHGMFDCHVAMRRLCDWDLWLRLLRGLPWRPVPATVSRVARGSDARSLAFVTADDRQLFRFLHSLRRDEQLTPARWREVAVDATAIGGVEVPAELRRRLVAEQLEPWRRSQERDLVPSSPPGAGAGEANGRAVTVLLWTSDAYYATMRYGMEVYGAASAGSGDFHGFYQPVAELAADWPRAADLVLFVRSSTAAASAAMRGALADAVPTGYFLDDDYLNLHRLHPRWARLAPEGDDRRALVEQIASADAVWTTPWLAGSLAALNRRLVPISAAVPASSLPLALRPRPLERPICIGAIGGDSRREEFTALWAALAAIAEEFSGRVRFEFWGLGLEDLPPLPAPVEHHPYDASFARFLARLQGAEFDILLNPLFAHLPARLAKTANKYQLTAVAGALGIFSAAAPYAELPADVTCLKASDEPEPWRRALRQAITMPAERFDALRRAMLAHVELELTAEALVDQFEAACRSLCFHARTRARRGADGRPSVLLVPAAEGEAWAEAWAAVHERYGVASLVEEREAALDSLLVREAPALVLAESASRELAARCAERGVPLVDAAASARLAPPLSEAQGARALESLLAAIARGDREAGGRIEEYRAARRTRHAQGAANRLLAAYLAALGGAGREPAPRPGTQPQAGAEPPPASSVTSPSQASEAAEPTSLRASQSGRDRVRSLVQRLGIYRPLSRAFWTTRRKRVLVVHDGWTVSTFLYYEEARQDLEAATGRRWLVRQASDVDPADLYSFHAVIFQRAISSRSVELLAAAKRQGCRTYYDADDHLWLIEEVVADPSNPWRVLYGAARPDIARLLAGVDAVKVYQPPAVPLLERHNPRVVVVRPYHLLVDGDEERERDVAGSPRVGFLGSYFKDADFVPVLEAMAPLLREGADLRFEFFGFLPQALAGDARITHLPWTRDYLDFRRRLLERHWQIGLAPLRDLDFNRCKTNIKYREYAAAGIAGIYSDVAIYRTTVVDRETGLLVPQLDRLAWRDAILELARKPELRRRIARNAFDDLRSHYRKEDYVAAVAELVG